MVAERHHNALGGSFIISPRSDPGRVRNDGSRLEKDTEFTLRGFVFGVGALLMLMGAAWGLIVEWA